MILEIAAGMLLARLILAVLAVAVTNQVEHRFIEGTRLPWYWAVARVFTRIW